MIDAVWVTPVIRKSIILLGAVLVCAQATKADLYDWHAYNGHQYALTKSNLDWFTAETEALSVGGQLVTINDAFENQWLVDTFAADTLGIAWIGYYLDTDANWKWIDGEPVTYTNYYFMFPQGGVHAYIHTWGSPSYAPGTWNANPDVDLIAPPWGSPAGIIEKPLTVVPAPSANILCLLGIGFVIAVRRGTLT